MHTTPSTHPLAITSHTVDPTLNPDSEDIMSKRVSPDGTPCDPGSIEPLHEDLLAQLRAATEAAEELARERDRALQKAAKAAREAELAKASAKRTEQTYKTALSRKEDFISLWIDRLPHPACTLEVDPHTGRTVVHLSVVLNEQPRVDTYNGRTSHVAGETVVNAAIPWAVMTKAGLLPVKLRTSLKLTLAKDSTLEYTTIQRTGKLQADVDLDESEESRSQLFIPSRANPQLTADTVGTGGPNAHDLLQNSLENRQKKEDSLTQKIRTVVQSSPVSLSTAALLTALEDVRPRGL